MKFGFTSTSFKQIKDVYKIADIGVSCGAEMIEWSGGTHVTDMQTAKLAKLACDGAGIRISSFGTYYRVGSRDEDEWKRICEMSSAMECDWVRVWLGKKDSQKTAPEEYLKIAEDTSLICETAKKYNLVVCPECHDHTFNNNTDAFLKLYNDVKCDNLKTYFQSRYKKKEYDLDRIERTLPHIECVHISFSEQVREQFPKSDRTYIDALLGKLISSGYDKNMLLEYTYLYGFAGIPSMMVKDMNKLRKKVREIK